MFGDRWWWFCYTWRRIAIMYDIGWFNDEDKN